MVSAFAGEGGGVGQGGRGGGGGVGLGGILAFNFGVLDGALGQTTMQDGQ